MPYTSGKAWVHCKAWVSIVDDDALVPKKEVMAICSTDFILIVSTQYNKKGLLAIFLKTNKSYVKIIPLNLWSQILKKNNFYWYDSDKNDKTNKRKSIKKSISARVSDVSGLEKYKIIYLANFQNYTFSQYAYMKLRKLYPTHLPDS